LAGALCFIGFGGDMHDLLMLLTANYPMKTIEILGEPYLERYHVKTDEDGTQHWLHRFLRNDSERHQHSHPWEARSKILCGSYLEDRSGAHTLYQAGMTNLIMPETMHRIVEVEPNTWTYMRVLPGRAVSWAFIDDSGARTPMATSPEDWWKDCKVRGV